MATDVTIGMTAKDAGFPQDQIKTAVMVALAESGGNERATNHNSNGTTDYGLWQINSIHTAELKTGDWQKPLDNGKMAYSIWKRDTWGAWTTYKNNSYLKFETRAAAVMLTLGLLGQAPGQAPGGTTVDLGAATPLDTIGKLFDFVSNGHNWQRVGMIVGGAILVGLALYSLMKQTGVVDAGAKTIGVITDLATP